MASCFDSVMASCVDSAAMSLNLCHPPPPPPPPPETLREIPKAKEMEREREELSDEEMEREEEEEEELSYKEIAALYPDPWIQPRQLFWDPDDPETWEHYLHHPRLFRLLPFLLPSAIGEEILSLHPLFELYSIEIKDLDPEQQDFDGMILITNHSTGYVPVVIYKPGPGVKNITTGQPLPLKGPQQSLNANYPVVIALTNPINFGWFFHFDPAHKNFEYEYDKPLRKEFKDPVAYSKAVVWYEVIKEAVRVTLVFQFVPLHHQGGKRKQPEEEEEEEFIIPTVQIQILEGGTIFATNDGKPKTKRIVKHFSSHQMSKTNNVLPVDRYVFAVPKGSNFQVTADLKYSYTTATGGEQGSPFQINETLSFHAPNQSDSHVQFFETSTRGSPTRLRLKVIWTRAKF